MNAQIDIKAPIKGVIFDLDGTLVTSSLNFSIIRGEIGCPGGEDILAFIDAIPNLSHRQKAKQQVIANEMRDADSATIIEGVNKFLSELKRRQLPTAVVTRNCRAATDVKLQRHDLNFEIVLTRECAPPKPDPTALLDISQTWNIEPEYLIYVGDYIYDIQTARNAGMRSVLMAFDSLPDWHTEASIHCSDYHSLQQHIDSCNE